MRRRSFVKSLGALGATAALPINNDFFIRAAKADTPTYDQIQFSKPAVLPQVINIFLYGGPSELAGNLSNIDDINANSQNPYPNSLLTTYDPTTAPNGNKTVNNFWRNGGGHEMELMLADGEMTVYRTLNRVKDNTRAHRPSIRSSLTGNLDYDNYPGMGVTLAASLLHVENTMGSGSAIGKPLNQMVLPFVSFEGESTAFQPDGDNPLPLYLKDISLDTNFNNPYDRSGIGDSALDTYAEPRNQATKDRYTKVYDAFETRKQLETLVGGFKSALDGALPVIPSGSPDASDSAIAADDGTNTGTMRVVYPQNNAYTGRLKAAVTLAIANPDSVFITVGGGLGGWDDHDNSLTKYANRMNDLMTAIRSAMKHIKYSDISNGGARDTSNIIINVMGDFGRNVNLNGSMGWDHGNNQNLYTFGGASVRAGGASALGKVVGTTERFGATGQNRQFTRPTQTSYQAEPMSVASTIFSYFGIQNPEILTSDPNMNPTGENPLDETVAGVALGTYTP